jgi:hypothetical protein
MAKPSLTGIDVDNVSVQPPSCRHPISQKNAGINIAFFSIKLASLTINRGIVAKAFRLRNSIIGAPILSFNFAGDELEGLWAQRN